MTFESKALLVDETKNLRVITLRELVDAETLEKDRRTAYGIHLFDFTRCWDDSAASMARAGRGFSVDACWLMLGKKVFFYTFVDSDGVVRTAPYEKQFTDSEREVIFANPDASFKWDIFKMRFPCNGANAYFVASYINKKYCAFCGKLFDDVPHRCNAVACSDCGREIDENAEAMNYYRKTGNRLCPICAKKRAGKLYSYHCRPNGSRPIFEKPDDRANTLHLGAEIEVDGSEDFSRTSACGSFNDILNSKTFYSPFVEFETDGSLNNGVEVITAPTTLKGFLSRYEDIKAFYEKANSLGGVFNSANGLHFHLDREYFGTDNESRSKAAVLIEMMVYKYFDFFATICRRPASRFNYAHTHFMRRGYVAIISRYLQKRAM